ncbi:DUF6075 family protein [Clostridium sp.]|uniref:DUF6075 family protein n=1 Tax=Clostridium sp. TaxID=1506 RepID=UPI003464AF42
MNFINNGHKVAFNTCMSKSGVNLEDRERVSMFYILSGCDDLVNKGIYKFYDFNKNIIKPGSLRRDLCSSSKSMVKLAFHLYNGNHKNLSIMDIIQPLDKSNRVITLNAIAIDLKWKGL